MAMLSQSAPHFQYVIVGPVLFVREQKIKRGDRLNPVRNGRNPTNDCLRGVQVLKVGDSCHKAEHRPVMAAALQF